MSTDTTPISWTERISGAPFDLSLDGSVKAEQIVPWEIAHALSQTYRFTGHTRFPVSVADHSSRALCALDRIGPYADSIRLAVLLHDAPEVFSGDISRPMIQLIDRLSCGGFRDWKRKFETSVMEALGVTCLEQDGVRDLIKRADNIALMAEHINHHRSSESDWQEFLKLSREDLNRAKNIAAEEPSLEKSWRHIRGKFSMQWILIRSKRRLDPKEDFYDPWEKHGLL